MVPWHKGLLVEDQDCVLFCGKGGHWKNECPQSQTNNKLSIYDLFLEFHKGAGCEKDNVKVESLGFEGRERVSPGSKEVFLSQTSDVQSKELSPVGRLRQCKENWAKVTDNQYILNLIESG